MKKGIFITLEGADGCGKTTQAPLLARFLQTFNRKVVHSREPGGTAFAEQLRSIILDPKLDIQPVAELLLYQAARAQHTAMTVLPALKAGALVLCERYIDATLAYQGYGRGLDRDMIHQLNDLSTQHLLPHLTLVLDVPLAESLRRRAQRQQGPDRMEKASQAFHARVIKGYRSLARQEPKRIKLISGLGSPEAVQKRLQNCVQDFLSA